MSHGLIAEEYERLLIDAVASGDVAAVDELYRVHSDPVMRFIFRRVDEQLEDAEEITLDTFVSAINLAGGYDGSSSVRTWLCGIAKLRIVDFYRKKDRGKRVPDSMTEALDELRTGSTGFEEILNRVEARHVVDAMLADLTKDEREALLLHYVEQLSIKEAAALMNRSEKGIESLITRAKTKAKNAFGDWTAGGAR